MSKIGRFEALAEQLVEGTFARLFTGSLQPYEIGIRIARAMEDGQLVLPDGLRQAPTHYTLRLHPDAIAAFRAQHPTLEQDLIRYVEELAAQAGLVLPVVPSIQIVPSPDIHIHEVRIETEWLPDDALDGERTREIQRMDSWSAEEASHANLTRSRAFLILHDRRHVLLTQPVVSIGRSLENDIVIEDRRVSRRHAQLRRRYDRYVLYDLGSQGGTRVNGHIVEECVLHSGDVISLAGVELIYGEEPGDQPLRPPGSETPTMGPVPVQRIGSKTG